MSSHTKRIGEIGECAIVYNLMKIDGVGVSKPIGDNLPYDLIIDANNKLFKCQIKTCEFVRDDKMVFHVSISNPFTKINKKYTSEETDLFLLYCIENEYCGLLTFDDYTSKEIIIRNNLPVGYYYKDVKLSEEFDMRKRLLYLQENGCFDSPKVYSRDKSNPIGKEYLNSVDMSVDSERWKIIQESDIDYTKFGWANKLSKLFGITPQVTMRYVREHYPNFYVNCYHKTS